MALLDSVMFTAGSNGLAAFTDGAAVQGFRNLSGGGGVSGVVYSYRAESADKSQWEEGAGVYNGSTLARTVFVASSTGSPVNFTAAPVVFITLLKGDFELVAYPLAHALYGGI